MVIDTPTINDIAALVVESEAMFNQMGFAEYGNGWEYDKVVEWWTDVITNSVYDVVVARDGCRIIGVSVVAYRTAHFWHTRGMKACEMVHHAVPDLSTTTICRIMIEMLKAIIVKIKAKGAEFFYIGYDPKPEFAAWGRYLLKKGYIDTSHVMMAKVGDL